MREILPMLSCECTEEEFLNGDAGNYQTVYIRGNDGKRWKHVKLQGGGNFRFEVKSIPGEDAASFKSTLDGELNFLPDGKIPYVLLQQIIKFFRQVMKNLGGAASNVKHGELEAMAHILWHPDRGYFVGIPEQRVSKAAVSYDYNYIPEGAMVVVDIHSHNSMGAFFSGTDNRDDARGIWISGVAGKLDKEKCELVWRFNYETQKVELKMADIFEVQEDVDFPEEWLSKVKRETYRPKGGYMGGTTYGVGGPGKVTPGKSLPLPMEGDKVRVPVEQRIVGGLSMYLDFLGRRVVPKGMGTGVNPSDWEFYDRPIDDVFDNQLGFGFGFGSDGAGMDMYFSGDPGISPLEDDAFLDSLSGEGYIDQDELDDLSLANLQQQLIDDIEEDEEEDEEEEELDEDPKEQALLWLEGVVKDKELMEVLTDCYERLSEKGKAKIAEQGL